MPWVCARPLGPSEDVALRDNSQSSRSFLAGNKNVLEQRRNFLISEVQTQKLESEQPFETLAWRLDVVWSVDVVPRAHWKGFLKLSLVSCPVALYSAVAASERVSFRQVNKQTGNRLRQQLVDVVTGEPVQTHNKGRGYEVGENEFLLVRDDELAAAEQEGRSRAYSSVPAKSAVQRDEQHQPAGVQAPGLFHPGPTKRMPRRQDEPQAVPAEPQSPDPTPASAAPTPPTPIGNNRTIEIDRFIPRAQVDARYLDTPYYVVPRDEVGGEAFAVIRDAMRAKDVVGMGRVVLARRERPIVLERWAMGSAGSRYATATR